MRRLVNLALFASLALVGSPAAVATEPTATTTADAPELRPGQIRRGNGRFPYEETVLENGLRVISLEDDSTPIAAVQLWYHVGSKDERPDRNGFAHMFEHMMFRGTEKLGNKEHFDYVRRTGGNCNAYTAFDQTVYVQEFPSNQLEMVLWMEAERMANLRVDEGGFATERNVVKEEWRMGRNQPYGDMLPAVLDFLFTTHPYRWSPIGDLDHLQAASVDELMDFWETYYVPNNATLVVVGDVDHAEVRKLARKSFGWIPRCDPPPRVTHEAEPTQTQKRRIELEPKNGPVPIAALAFRGVPQGHDDALPLDMLMQILGGGESSRVYVDVVRRKDAAAMALGIYIGMEQAGFAALAGIAMPFGDTDKIMDALWEQVELVKKDGVTDAELAKVRNQIARSQVTEALTVASKANLLGSAHVLEGDAQRANTYFNRVRTVTADDLKRVANTYLVEELANEIVIEPGIKSMLGTVLSLGGGGKGQEQAEEEEIDAGRRAVAQGPKAEATPPKGYPEAPPVAPPLAVDIDISGDERLLENGLKLVVVENDEVPFVSASLRFRVGAFTEDPDFAGTAAMAASMITRGTFVRDAETLAAELEQHAISLAATAEHDSMSVNVAALPDQFDRALRLLSEVVQVPAFDAKEFKTLRDQTVTGMAITETTPTVIADRSFDAALWGDHVYARPAEGTSEDVQELSNGVLEEWWHANALPENAVLYVVGDVDAEAVEASVKRYLGTWEGDGTPTPRPPLAKTARRGTVIRLVDKPGAIQSEIRAGHEGITRDHAMYAPGVVLTQVFGGAFSSRLMESIRVEKGLTYGASGGLSSRRLGGTFGVRTFTKTETTAETVRAVIEEVERMRDVPPTDAELSDAVSYLAGSFAGSLETPQAVSGRLWTLELNDLPRDYWNTYLKRISQTTSADVAEVAQALLDPDQMTIVVVGDAKAIKESLEEIAPVEVISEGR